MNALRGTWSWIAPLSRFGALALCTCGAVLGRAAAQPPQSGAGEEPVVVTPEHARAVERGLAWLAANPDTTGPERGAWIAKIGYKLNTNYQHTAADKGHVGVTAAAGMAFLAGGHLPGRGEYGKNVEAALEFVLSCVQGDGYITHGGSRMYSHAFASRCLAEVFGQTHRQDIKAKLQLTIDMSLASAKGS